MGEHSDTQDGGLVQVATWQLRCSDLCRAARAAVGPRQEKLQREAYLWGRIARNAYEKRMLANQQRLARELRGLGWFEDHEGVR